MRVLCLRAFTFAAIPLTLIAGQPALVTAQAQAPVQRGGAVVVVAPEIRTRIEALLASPNVTISTDYYRIDLRFGPHVRIDAVVVTAVDSKIRLPGLRVQVRDESNPNRLAGTSFLDLDEARSFSRALASMSELANSWTGRDDRRANELTFTSAGGLRLAVNSFGRVQRLSLSTGLLDPVVTALEITELITLRQAVEQALVLIDEK